MFYFVVRTHGIAAYLPGIWAIPLFIISFFSIYLTFGLSKTSWSYLSKLSKWIWISGLVIFVAVFLEHGNFRLYETFRYLLLSIPFYLIGYYWAVNGYENQFRRVIWFTYYFWGIYLFTKIIRIQDFGSISDETLGRLFYSGATESLNNLIFFWPFMAFASLVSLGFLLSSSNLRRKVLWIFFCIYIIAFVLSGFAATIFLVGVALVIYYFLSQGSRARVRLIIAIPLMFFVGFIAIYLLGSGDFGFYGDISNKAAALLTAINNGIFYDDFILDQITSNRWTAYRYSINQFFSKPIWGHGAYLESTGDALGNLDLYTTASGGHSFILDTLAYFGILGLPIVFILVKLFTISLSSVKLSSSYMSKRQTQLVAGAFGALLLSNLLNSSFLFSSFDNYIFFVGGFVAGKYVVKSISRVNIEPVDFIVTKVELKS